MRTAMQTPVQIALAEIKDLKEVLTFLRGLTPEAATPEAFQLLHSAIQLKSENLLRELKIELAAATGKASQ